MLTGVILPAQHLSGVPVTAKSDNSKFSVALGIAGHPATFEGQATDENTIAGTFTQDGKSLPLTLKKQVV